MSQHGERRVGTAIRVGAAAMSFGAAEIHAAVIPAHLRESWLYGVFFIGVAASQALWGVLVLVRPTRRIVALGGVGAGAVALVWLVSRTAGIPVGPGGGGREAAGLIDALATAFEVGIAIEVVLLIRTGIGGLPLSGAASSVATLCSCLIVAGATVAAVAAVIAGSGPSERRPVAGLAIRPHLVHVVLFLCAVATVIVYSMIDRHRIRQGAAGARS